MNDTEAMKIKVSLLEKALEKSPCLEFDKNGRLVGYERVKELNDAKEELLSLQWTEAGRIVEEWLK